MSMEYEQLMRQLQETEDGEPLGQCTDLHNTSIDLLFVQPWPRSPTKKDTVAFSTFTKPMKSI